MVARVKPFIAVAAILLCGAAAAGGLPDPTRPPAELIAPPSSAASSATGALQLQSVLVGPGRTPAAVISGELVLLGGRVRDARLVRVTERSAVLRGPQGDTTLPLIAIDPPGLRASTREPTR